MSKLRSAFAAGSAFAAFFTCGDPDLETTAAAIRAAVDSGADLIELGIPFSDPTAEGPAIQASNLRALKAGITTDRVFEFVGALRHDVAVPVVLVTYANVVFSYGAERFLAACRERGVDGLLLLDLPFEEKDEFRPLCRECGVDLISVIAPTSGERAAMIAREAEGFLYILSSLGGGELSREEKRVLAGIVKVVRENTDVPCAVSFGTASPEQMADFAALADGVIVDLDIVALMEKYGKDAPEQIGTYVRTRKAAMKK